jgi:hypothetical protein
MSLFYLGETLQTITESAKEAKCINFLKNLLLEHIESNALPEIAKQILILSSVSVISS